MVPILRYFLGNEIAMTSLCKSLDKQLYIFLWLQVPAVLFQFFVHGAGDQVEEQWVMDSREVISISIYLTIRSTC